jgi:hypothetical protein
LIPGRKRHQDGPLIIQAESGFRASDFIFS